MNKKQCVILGRALALIWAVGAFAQPVQAADPLPFKGYACCNLHYEKDWISDGNYAALPLIPAGTPISVLSFGRHKANADVNGRKMRLATASIVFASAWRVSSVAVMSRITTSSIPSTL